MPFTMMWPPKVSELAAPIPLPAGRLLRRWPVQLRCGPVLLDVLPDSMPTSGYRSGPVFRRPICGVADDWLTELSEARHFGLYPMCCQLEGYC